MTDPTETNSHADTKRIAIIASLLALVSACMISCAPPEGHKAAPPLPKVTVASPQMGVITNLDEYPGHLEAVETVEIKPRVTGYINSVHFQDGAEVKAGDLLFIIDPRPYQADLDRAEADRQKALAEKSRVETRLELAKNDLQRAAALKSSKAISEEEFDSRSKAAREAESAVASAQAAIASAEASVSAAKLNIEFTQIKAPISGRIGRRMVTPGNFVQLQGGGGSAPSLATIVSMDPVYCNFDADEEAFIQYQEAAKQRSAPIQCGMALVTDTGFPNKGTIDFFNNHMDAQTGTIRMRAVFANTDRKLVPGMFAKVQVPAGKPFEAMLIPDVAIGSDQGRKFVLTLNPENVVQVRPVQTDRRVGVSRVILGGLTLQDRVIVNGLMMARPGVKVEAVVANVPPAASGAPAPVAAATVTNK